MRSCVVALSVVVECLAGCTERAPPPLVAPPPALVASAMTSLAAVDAGPKPDPDPADEADLVLTIPARSQAPESPPAGWCGETAIQEGLLFLGRSVPQSAINRAGRPVHPDLYATEIPTALHP